MRKFSRSDLHKILHNRFLTRRRIMMAGLASTAAIVLVPVITYASYAKDIQDKERLMNRNSTGVILRDKNGTIFYEDGRLNGEEDLKLSEVSDIFENAVMASEDQDFRKHEGYSVKGIASAIYANVLNRDPTRYGGSTITQQLVKNKLLSADKSFLRKYQEVSMAIAVERRYTKDEILEMYINSVYFGEGAFGISDAAKTYFNKSAQELTLAESSMLVGLLPAPTAYSPVSGDKEKSKQQQERVLSKMIESGIIDEQKKKQALAQPLSFAASTDTSQTRARHFAMMVLNELSAKYGEETVIRSGYDVTTTLDLGWQDHAENKVRERVAVLGKAGARNAGLVALDPKTGQVQALVGSVDWNNNQFGKVNMAFSPRQPGSSFKPIYYSEAINRGLINPATIIRDAPKTYGETYKPTNYDFKYRGDISIRNALAQSLNIPAVEVMQKLGVNEAVATAQRMGISTVDKPDMYGLSLALGTAETSLFDMTKAYSAFANSGLQHNPVMILGIKDKYDDTVFSYKQTAPKPVTSPEAAYITSDILSDNTARAPTFGSSLNIANREVAVKTGTTNDSRDAWTIGYTPNVVVGVWMGNNENQPMVGLAGSSSAGGIWRNTMSAYLQNLPAEDFKRPDNVVTLAVCTRNGQRAVVKGSGTREEIFIKGKEPGGECNKQPPAKPKEEKRNDGPKPEEHNQEVLPDQDDELTPGRGGDDEDNAGPDNGEDGGDNTGEDEPQAPPGPGRQPRGQGGPDRSLD